MKAVKFDKMSVNVGYTIRHYNGNWVFFQVTLFNGNNLLYSIRMKFSNCAFNKDVKIGHTFQDIR